MTWSYSGDPSASTRDAVRFLLGDTDDTDQVFSDEEIDWLLTETNNVYYAAAMAAEAVSSSLQTSQSNDGVSTKTVGALSISYNNAERAKEFRDLARSLRVRGALNGTLVIYSGGISKADKLTREQDSDWDKPDFARGMFDYPGSELKPLEMATTST